MRNSNFYKARRKDDREWVCGYIVESMNDGCFILEDVTLCGDGTLACLEGEFHQVDRHTVCQFTGVLDRCKLKVWENDILLTPVGRAVVRYVTEPMEWLHGHTIGFYLEFEDSDKNNDYRHDLGYWSGKSEVIGSVFDRKVNL